MGHLQSNGKVETRKLGSHQGRAHKLALDAGHSGTFYSCGEDGAVRHFDLRERGAASRTLLLCRASRHGQVRACPNPTPETAAWGRRPAIGAGREVKTAHVVCYKL